MVKEVSELEIITGPMMSGKSTSLITKLIVSNTVYPTLYINHKLDKRSLKSVYSTHNPMINMLEVSDVPFDCVSTEDLASVDISNYKVIGIDEGQFFSDLKDTVMKWLELYEKKIYVAGLDSDANQHQFGQILDLVMHANRIHKLHSFCMICKSEGKCSKAIYTIHKNRLAPHEQIEVGDGTTYTPVCRKHCR